MRLLHKVADVFLIAFRTRCQTNTKNKKSSNKMLFLKKFGILLKIHIIILELF